MIEAFEIGVTLALSDGVSDGIAHARKEMAAFEQVLTTGGLSVAQLRKAGAEAVPTTKQQPDGRDTAAKLADPPLIVEPTTDAAENRFASSMARPGETARQERQQESETVHVIEAAGRQAFPQRDDVQPASVSVAAPVDAPDWSGDHRIPAFRSVALVEPAPTRTVSDDEQFAGEPASAPATLFNQVNQQTNSVSVSDEAMAYSSSAVKHETAAPNALEYGTPNIVHVENTFLPNPASNLAIPSAPAGHWPHRSSTSTIVLPLPPLDTTDAARSVWLSDEGQLTREAAAAPTGSEVAGPSSSNDRRSSSVGAAQRPAEGDVFLDGMLVGRWMSRFLAKEAGRASVGPTGFDARRGRLLPGATVGS